MRYTCPTCHGNTTVERKKASLNGEVDDYDDCPTCGGTGWLETPPG